MSVHGTPLAPLKVGLTDEAIYNQKQNEVQL